MNKRPRLTIGLALAAWLTQAVAALSQQPTGPRGAEAPSPLGAISEDSIPAFRRIFVPADKIGSQRWPSGYIPVDADRFQQLLETVRAKSQGTPSTAAPRIEKAEYAAQLVGDDVLVGTFDLQVSAPRESRALLTFVPCTPAITATTWHDQQGKPAIAGADPQGRPRVVVEGARLQGDWSLRGERTAAGMVNFDFEMPPCPVARIDLRLAPGLQPVTDEGVVSAKADAGAEGNRWIVELGGHHRVNVRIVPDGARRDRSLVFARQAATYDFSPRGISLTTQLRLDVHGEAIEQLALELDPSLRLVGARLGETDVPWSATIDATSGISRVVLQFVEPLVGTGRVLQLLAVAPLDAGKLIGLPLLRTPDLSWQEGSATLLIPGSLVLDRLRTEGCRQSSAAALPAPATGESIEIQYHRANPFIEVLLAQPREPVKVDRGSLVEVGSNEISSRVSVQLSVARGEIRHARFEINPGWTIDSVEHLSVSEPVEWEVEESDAGLALLKVRPQRGAFTTQPARLSIRGHRPAPNATNIEGHGLSMLAFNEFQIGTRLIMVRAADGLELRWSGSEELNPADGLSLDSIQAKLFPQLPGALVFVENAQFAQATMSVQRRRPGYTVDVRIDVVVHQESLTETFAIQGTLEGARAGRVLVHLSRRRDLPLEWTLAGANSGQLSARKLSVAEQAQTGLPPSGEGWELLLNLKREGLFELRAVRRLPFVADLPLTLASIADAATQRGTLTVRGLGDAAVSIKNRGLTKVPAELLEADRYQTVRAAYRYRPLRDDLGAEPVISLSPAKPVQAVSGAWAWTARLDSRYGSDGASVHWATWRVQTGGHERIALTLPEGAQLQTLWIDDRTVSSSSTAGRRLDIDLPSGRSVASVAAYFSLHCDLPRLVESLSAPMPELDIPVMNCQWSLWLPPEYDVPGFDERMLSTNVEPLNGFQRLFGAFGRRRDSTWFNPLSVRQWRDWWAGGSDLLQAQAMGTEFVEAIDGTLRSSSKGEDFAWGQWLASASADSNRDRRALLIDGEALRWLGIGPKSRVRLPEGANPRALDVLSHAGLALIAGRNAIVVTSRASAASYVGQLSAPQARSLYFLADGPLADELQQAGTQGTWSRFATVENWQAAPERDANGWLPCESARRNLNETRGWSNVTLEFKPNSQPQLLVARVSSMGALAWALFLALVGLGLWKNQTSPLVLVLLICAGACTSLLLPAAYLPLTTNAMFAGLVSLAARSVSLPRRQVARDPSGSARAIRSGLATQGARLLLGAAMLQAASALIAGQSSGSPEGDHPASVTAAQKAPENPPPAEDSGDPSADPRDSAATRKIYRVVVPTDAAGEPVNGKYFVPEELYKHLSRQATEAIGAAPGWLLTRGSYQGTLSRSAVGKQLALAGLRATFDVHVFRANVEVRVPFAREGLVNSVGTVHLDGRPLVPRWSPQGKELILGPLSHGVYRLQVELQPALQTDLNQAGFELSIPPVAGATLELALPVDAPSIEVGQARGQVRTQIDPAALIAQLGATDRLVVRWPLGNQNGALANLEVDELIWIKVRPGTTILDARFKFRVLSGQVRQISLATDPRLQLLSPSNSQTPFTARTIPGNPKRIDLTVSRAVSDQMTLDLSFLLTDATGVGNLRSPRLETIGAKPSKRYLAVSVDPALQYRDQYGEDSRRLDVAEFAAEWGTSETRPQAAYSVPRGEPMWVLATQPNTPQISAEQSLAVNVGRTATAVKYRALLNIAPRGHVFQFDCVGPRGLSVDAVSLLDDSVERVARWSSDPAGRITVFLSGPVEGRQTLTLSGSMPTASGETMTLPRIELQEVDARKSRLQLYRQPAVLVDVPRDAPLSPLPANETPADPDFPFQGASLVGRYVIEDATAAWQVKLLPNAPKTRAVAVTRLHRDGERWIAELEYELQVTEGLVDLLQFEIPPQWVEPFRFEPATRYQISSLPGDSRRQMTVVPERPVDGKFRLKIVAGVLRSGDRLRVPEILPLRTTSLERFVVLPQYLDLQQVAWDTSGLERGTLPPEFATPRNAQSQAILRVSGERFQATLGAVERTDAAAQLRLADQHVIWQPDGACQGITQFLLQPGGANTCLLELPAGAQLVHATVEDLPAQIAAESPLRWRLTLGPQRLPQRIEIVYTGTVAPSGESWRFTGPRLVDLDAEQTLWTIYAPPRFGPGVPLQASWMSTPAQHEVARLKAIATLVQGRTEDIGEHQPEDLARWQQPWSRRFFVSRAALLAESTMDGQTLGSAAKSAEAIQLDAQVNAVEKQLRAAAPSARRTASTDPSAEMLAGAQAQLRPTRLAVTGKSYDVTLRYPQVSVELRAARWAAATGLLATGIALAILLRGVSWPMFAPWIVLGALGLFWWLWLTPHVVGVLLVVLAIWSAWRGKDQPALHWTAD